MGATHVKNRSENQKGVQATFAASIIWGLFPIYFSALGHIPALEVLSCRIVWALPFVIVAIIALRRLAFLVAVFRDRKKILFLAASASCIGVNWGVYIWAAGRNHTLDVSLGYFISPLFTLALGAIFLKERLTVRQSIAVALVFVGVSILAYARGGLPWVAIALPISFGFYSLIRKLVDVDALTGFTVESAILTPIAATFLFNLPNGGAILNEPLGQQIMLVLAGPLTAVPIMLFTYGARRVKLSVLGLMQYISPSMQIFIAVLLLGETLTPAHMATYSLVWCGLLLYSFPNRKARPTKDLTK